MFSTIFVNDSCRSDDAMTIHKRIFLLCDLEGSSLCRNYTATTFLGKGWPKACLGMTKDVNAVVSSLFAAGVEQVVVKDFHRTGYNIFSSQIDSRAIVLSGYAKGPVPGLGSPLGTTGLMMIGMHAPSGSEGFLAHTLTSRISKLVVNGQPLSEAELFSAVISSYHISPLFFSGCPVACQHALRKIKGIHVFPIEEKDKQKKGAIQQWRKALSKEAVNALSITNSPHRMSGPFHVSVTMKGEKKAAKRLSTMWKHRLKNTTISFCVYDIQSLYMELIKLAYLTPMGMKLLPIGLPVYNFLGKMGQVWAGRQLKNRYQIP